MKPHGADWEYRFVKGRTINLGKKIRTNLTKYLRSSAILLTVKAQRLPSRPLGQRVPRKTQSAALAAMPYFNTTMWGSVVADEVPDLPRVESAATQVFTIQLSILFQLLHPFLTTCHLSVPITPIKFAAGDFSSAVEAATYLKTLS